MEAANTSEVTGNFYRVTWRNIPKDSHHRTCRCENLKSHLQLHTPPQHNHSMQTHGHPPSLRKLMMTFRWKVPIKSEFKDRSQQVYTESPPRHSDRDSEQFSYSRNPSHRFNVPFVGPWRTLESPYKEQEALRRTYSAYLNWHASFWKTRVVRNIKK
jgi:hypothetical protein